MLLDRLRSREARERRGFTLIEVLVVVAIIVILAGGATMLVLNRLAEAKRKTTYTRFQTLDSACQQFYSKYGRYPDSLSELADNSNGTAFVEQAALYDAWDQPISYQAEGNADSGGKPVLYVQHGNINITNYGPPPD